MPLDYDAFQGIATSHIELFGRDAVLRAIDGTSQIPVTVIMSNYGARERDGELIARDDRRALVAAKPGVAPDPELHRLVVDGKALRIVSVAAKAPGGTVLYYVCQVRL